MPKPLGQFFITDPFTTSLGWKLAPGQMSVNSYVYVNNQTPQEFDIWGNGVDYLGKAPAWISYYKFVMPLVYAFVEFRPTMSLNPLYAPALYVNGLVFESYERDPLWQPIAVVRQTDPARQNRVVAVPIGLAHWNTGTWHAGDPATNTLATALVSAAQLALPTPRAPVYCYYANIAPESNLTGTMVFQLQMQWQDAGGASVGGPTPFARATCSANAANSTTTPYIFAPIGPFVVAGPIPSPAIKAAFQLVALGGTRLDVDFTVAIWMDQFNPIGDTDIGTQAIYNAAVPSNPFF